MIFYFKNFNKAYVERHAENVHYCDYAMIMGYTGHILQERHV